ncbi:MAG TPA: enoyl-CoA hydratase/isomerase family protein [Acidobacteriaceae bacterium]|nr:enoyl-CoA hydratase/isomerase family protein [Acidobacteriaceae bacterium]
MSDVLIRIAGSCGRITLNRPQTINALTLEMVNAMEAALVSWAADPTVRFVLVDGAGERGLCAGGDIRALYTASVNGRYDDSTAFFRAEYRLNYLVSRFPKPYVVLMDRLVMGGGIGVSAHGSHRVVTERSELGMPETGIGFFPDVGGTYLLSSAPDQLGMYVGLTGRRLGAADSLRCGLADYVVNSARLTELTAALELCCTGDEVERCLGSYACEALPGMPVRMREWVERCFAQSSVESILSALQVQGDTEADTVMEELKSKSPTSLKLTFLAIRRGARLGTLEACLQQEFRLAQAMVRGHDFVEGVRAAVIDKDRNPQWCPASLDDVSPEMIARLLPETSSRSLDLTYPEVFP